MRYVLLNVEWSVTSLLLLNGLYLTCHCSITYTHIHTSHSARTTNTHTHNAHSHKCTYTHSRIHTHIHAHTHTQTHIRTNIYSYTQYTCNRYHLLEHFEEAAKRKKKCFTKCYRSLPLIWIPYVTIAGIHNYTHTHTVHVIHTVYSEWLIQNCSICQ